MEEKQITAKCGEPVPQIIPTAHMHQFVPKNVHELLSLQPKQKVVRQKDLGAPPTGSRRRADICH
jgi:hypothetical protein